MSETPVKNVRNFAILGHNGSGKTTLTDAIAFHLGINDRLGLVDNGTSVSDTADEEKQRKTTIFASNFAAPFQVADQNYQITFTDTPGFMDFFGQALGAITAADSAIITVDASSGVQVGTRRAWNACKENGIDACAFVITGLDKENADFLKCVESIREAFGVNCVPVTAQLDDQKIVNLLDGTEPPAPLADAYAALTEAAAEGDEALMEKYFEAGELSAAEIVQGVVAGMASGSMQPIMATTATKGSGIQELLETICRIFPAPGTRVRKDNKDQVIDPKADGPLVAQVWRTAVDPFLGQLTFVRVLSGTLAQGAALYNTITDTKESASALMQVVGKKQTQIPSVGPGEIIAIPKLKNTKTGNTLVAAGGNTVLPEIAWPQPVMFMALEAKTQADEDRLSTAIHRLLDGDPTLHYEKQVETKQIVLKGLGDVHLDVAVALMKSQTNVNVTLSTPKVPYRESITAQGEGHYRHKKQSGGAGQFGEVYLRVFPRPEGDESEWFADKTVGGSIPGNFIPAVLKGVEEGMLAGSVAGYPVQNINVEVYDGSHHPVDSKEIAFKIAGMRALRDGMSKAKPVLLEPIMQLKITIPDAFMGAISGDLPNKRGRVLGMESGEGTQVITAEAPLAELFKYAAELRSITGGQGTFTMDFVRYDVVPSNVAQKVIAEAAKERKAETDD